MQPNEFILSKKEHKRYLNALMRMPGTQLHKQLVLTRAMTAVIFVVILALAFLVQLPGALQDPGRLQTLGSTTLVEIVLLALLAWFMPPWSLRRRQMRMETLNGIKGERTAETITLTCTDMMAENTLDEPEKIVPQNGTLACTADKKNTVINDEIAPMTFRLYKVKK